MKIEHLYISKLQPLAGGWDDNNVYATILKFDPRTLSWSQVGEMDQGRGYHGASVVRAEDVEQFCV